MPVKKSSTSSRKTISSMPDMPTMNPSVSSTPSASNMPSEKHDFLHGCGHMGMGYHCKSHGCHFGYKLMKTFYGILLVYLIIFVGTLIRNEIKNFDYIGVAPVDVSDRQLNISAEGVVDVVPNISVVTVGNSLREVTADEARNKNNQLITDFVTKVKALGIPATDIKTESPSMYPDYNYLEDGTRELAGYNINQSVTVKVRDNVDKASQVVMLAGEAGLNTIGGVESVVDDNTDMYLDQARQQAVSKAKAKAQKLANDLGVTLDGVISYNEYIADSGLYPKYMAMDMMEGYSESAPTIEPGTSQVSLNINITYKIK
ncbi:MAG: hypothetical protein A2493_01720 [Candidatus Magasanikbacteria bacterium RIFOXYC12_FULL_33_11]|uniref:SIMPL domain-containing protein n=1 Tax=Candidatus Magasanikbacteria bacterium RIFOXYC12_FULL_33_11 TaxID=1798701 RepID=A0A1F6NM83_9BACT|nr:MAG: hypothetical protein A2493_01720 [Candidatus Magasanikbacteria bacterium RIFOXYC12_FULL_33_11]